eukprot:766171-Hanusia_phi.AAC.1
MRSLRTPTWLDPQIFVTPPKTLNQQDNTLNRHFPATSIPVHCHCRPGDLKPCQPRAGARPSRCQCDAVESESPRL